MRQVILDSGILIAAVFREQFTARARTLLQKLQADQSTLHAPILMRYELIAVCRKAVYRGRISISEGATAQQLSSYPTRTRRRTPSATRTNLRRVQSTNRLRRTVAGGGRAFGQPTSVYSMPCPADSPTFAGWAQIPI
ncbi:MAG: type II toxin-antitoxin system VapC family toxin [Chloroflexi bacterium]|nr:type II toxin-antitoxin system VapC family toxin [Chloroflexota bacterium]